MTKRVLIFMTLGAFLFPVFGPLWGHDFQHAIHVVHEAHHLKKNHEHPPHDHSGSNSNADHQGVDKSLVSYIWNHHHGDLQISSKKGTRFTRGPLIKIINGYTYFSENDSEIILSSSQEQPPALYRNDLYLRTQRLRIGI